MKSALLLVLALAAVFAPKAVAFQDAQAYRPPGAATHGTYFGNCPSDGIRVLDEPSFRSLSEKWSPGYLAGDLPAPEPLSMPADLNYPGGLWSTRKPGSVVLAIFIDENGKPADVRVVCTSDTKFEKSALKFGRKMLFLAPLREDVAIRSTALQLIVFTP